MIERGSSVPHFEVRTVDGRTAPYSTIWQHKNLLLVLLPCAAGDAYASRLTEHLPAILAQDAECVITHEAVPGIPSPGVVIADRWGEVIFVSSADFANDLPEPEDLIEWLAYLQVRCPECEGEAR